MSIFTQFKNWAAGMYQTFWRNRQGFDRMLTELKEFREDQADLEVDKDEQPRDSMGRFMPKTDDVERYHGKNDNRIERP